MKVLANSFDEANHNTIQVNGSPNGWRNSILRGDDIFLHFLKLRSERAIIVLLHIKKLELEVVSYFILIDINTHDPDTLNQRSEMILIAY